MRLFTTKLLASLAFTFLAASCFASPAKEIESAFKNYVQGADKRSVALLDKVLHANFRSGFSMKNDPKVMLGDKEGYLSLIKAGKIGGAARNVKVQDVQHFGNTGVVRAQLTNSKTAFDGVFVFINEGNGWQLMQDMQVVEFK
ncbi:MAG: nuclear transport factor 2 family protein [Leptospiraceae bacterium]|nr:nuclear transport factor 2 family protein [Leptospiraceae bacterium]